MIARAKKKTEKEKEKGQQGSDGPKTWLLGRVGGGACSTVVSSSLEASLAKGVSSVLVISPERV